MEMSGEHRIEAPRQKVWEALNDPEPNVQDRAREALKALGRG